MDKDEQVLAEAIRRGKIEVSRLESQLANAHRAREIATSPFVGAAEVDQDTLPSDESIARTETKLAEARDYLAELQEAEDVALREEITRADEARAARAQTVEEARVAVVHARLKHDVAVAARLATSELGDIEAYAAAAEASDAALAELERARRHLDTIRKLEVA